MALLPPKTPRELKGFCWHSIPQGVKRLWTNYCLSRLASFSYVNRRRKKEKSRTELCYRHYGVYMISLFCEVHDHRIALEMRAYRSRNEGQVAASRLAVRGLPVPPQAPGSLLGKYAEVVFGKASNPPKG